MEKYKLGEISEFIRNGASIKQFDNADGYPITRIETISNLKIDFKKMGYANIYELGKSAVMEDDSKKIIHGMNLLCIRLKKEMANSKYMYYYFNHKLFRNKLSKIIKKSVNQASFSVTDLKKIDIEIPNIETQKKIVEILDKAQFLIDKKKEQIELLDELVKSRFIEMFGDPVSNSKDWKKQKINEVAPVSNYKGEFDEEKIWLLNLDMVESNSGRIIDFNYVNKEEIGSSTCTFDTSNVLYSKLRPYLNKVVIPDRRGYATSEMTPLKPNKKVLNREYLTYSLRNKSFVDYISEKVSGAKMPRVVMNDFKSFELPIPPIELQNEFAEFVTKIDEIKSKMKASLSELEDNFNSLMQKAFKGELF